MLVYRNIKDSETVNMKRQKHGNKEKLNTMKKTWR